MKNGRRSFLKGSAAVAPLILTAGPAAATNAHSSTLACVGRDLKRQTAGHNMPAGIKVRGNDEWLRKEVELYRLATLAGVTLPGDHFLGTDRVTYWRLDESRFGSATAIRTNHTVANARAHLIGRRVFALIYVDHDLRQVGFALERNGGAAVTGSCWVSVTPRRHTV